MDAHYSIHGIGTDAIEGLWFPGNDHELVDREVLSFHPSVVITDDSAGGATSALHQYDRQCTCHARWRRPPDVPIRLHHRALNRGYQGQSNVGTI